MTEYDLRQWRDCTTTTATLNIAAAKFKTWRTRIRFTEELLLEMMTDTFELWDSGLKGSLVDCAHLYNKVWSRMRILFRIVARTDILERDGFMNAFVSAARDITKILAEDSGKHTYASIADESTIDSGKESTE